jgi:hypothetical protein
MLALALGIVANAGLIIFDVAISIVTYPMMPTWEWWIFVLSGAGLVILAVSAQVMEFKAYRRDDERHTHEHEVLAQGNIAVLQRLAIATQTTGQSTGEIIQAAIQKIEGLESQLADISSIFWRRLRDDEKAALKTQLAAIGPHTIRIISAHPADCHELAGEFYRVFQSAGWQINQAPRRLGL